jgi:hypothetical protein
MSSEGNHAAELIHLMKDLGYKPDQMFNALNGRTRLYFDDVAHHRHVDVFVDAVRMCHEIRFKQRLALLDETLTPSDLLLTKLQIVELNAKDLKDAVALLHDHALAPGTNSAIDTDYLDRVWGNDWPLWRTCQLTLEKIAKAVPSLLDGAASTKVLMAVAALNEVLASGHKSLQWKLRAKVGDRIRWYEIPEEIA